MAHSTDQFEKKVAVIVTEYRFRSHADVIVGRLFGNYEFSPRIKVASLYTDQVPDNDLSREEAERYGVTIYPTIEEAVSVGASDGDPVDGVLVIGEHGDYPWNEERQYKEYPRRELMKKVLDALDKLNLKVPVFNDKHFSYAIEHTLWMYNEIQQRQLPFMGGSSIPLMDKNPPLEDKDLKSLKEVFAISWSKDIEAYGFHGIEVMQEIAEKRAGGETGVASVYTLEGQDVWDAMDRGEWPEDLMLQALSEDPDRTEGHPRDHVPDPVLFMFDYVDGTKGYVIQIQSFVKKWLSAFRCEDGRIISNHFVRIEGIPQAPHFARFTEYIEDMILTGESKVPIGRTLMTSGLTNLGMESLYRKQHIMTPELHITY